MEPVLEDCGGADQFPTDHLPVSLSSMWSVPGIPGENRKIEIEAQLGFEHAKCPKLLGFNFIRPQILLSHTQSAEQALALFEDHKEAGIGDQHQAVPIRPASWTKIRGTHGDREGQVQTHQVPGQVSQGSRLLEVQGWRPHAQETCGKGGEL